MKAGNLTAKEAVIKLEKLEYKGMLYDFYGELLTQHQKKIYEDAIFNDLSLSEIADEQGISRQGVYDLLKRCDKLLVDYEQKLHLVEKFSRIKQSIQQINKLTDDEQIKRLSNEIIEEL
ncbi:MAG: YlxM family DNA-binding protein [Lachnospiraceae bacterium]|nr:YlxM family DNA-binding protein [Lachnospiraceae bacterium]